MKKNQPKKNCVLYTTIEQSSTITALNFNVFVVYTYGNKYIMYIHIDTRIYIHLYISI